MNNKSIDKILLLQNGKKKHIWLEKYSLWKMER